MQLSFSVTSHAGLRRKNNEDSCCARPDLGLFVVADGVGGYDAGEVASRVAVEAFERAVGDTAGLGEGASWPFEFQPALGVDGNRLNWAFHRANTRIRAEAAAGRGREGMATTVAAILFASAGQEGLEPVRSATIGHVGDSRIYHLRAGALDRLTRDHSWVEDQVRAGLMSDRAARVHPRRNLLTRALSGSADPAVDLARVTLAAGDVVLLCSDGLYAALDEEQIAAVLTQEIDEQAACDALVDAANLAGGPDNITVILIRL